MPRFTRRETMIGASALALLSAKESLAMTTSGKVISETLIITNAKITTLDRQNPVAEAVASEPLREESPSGSMGTAVSSAATASTMGATAKSVPASREAFN